MPSIGEGISFSIFIASTITMPWRSRTSAPTATFTFTTLPGISASTVCGPETTTAAEPASSLLRSSITSRWKIRPPTSTSKPWAPFSSTIASNCWPSSMIE